MIPFHHRCTYVFRWSGIIGMKLVMERGPSTASLPNILNQNEMRTSMYHLY